MFHLVYCGILLDVKICLDFKMENSFVLRNKIFGIATILERYSKVLKPFSAII